MSTHHHSVDQRFDALGHRHRRRLLVALAERTLADRPQNDVVALSEAIAADSDVQRIQLQLTHCHLPKLEDFGYIRWNQETGTIERGPEWATLEPLLRSLASSRSSTRDALSKRESQDER